MSVKMIKAFKDYVLTNNRYPSSVYEFCKENKLKENDFYSKYNSFEALEKEWVQSIFRKVTDTLKKDENFDNYSSREKLLALFYAWTEMALAERSMLMYLAKDNAVQTQMGLKLLKMHFNEFVKHILDMALATGEIQERKFISDKYYHALWAQFLLIHKHWIDDKSKGFEKTDAFIEKTTTLAFDLMGQSALDSAIDLAKFMFQR